MDYSFEEVKKLFDNFNIQKNKNGEYIVVNRATKIYYDAKDFVDKVKFAHTWFQATRNGRSRTTLDLSVTTEDDYLYAFDHEAKEVYDYIMAVVSQTMQASGHLLRCEALVNEIKQAEGLRAHAYETAEGLYKNERFVQAFDTWVRKANNIPTYEEIQNNGIHR